MNDINIITNSLIIKKEIREIFTRTLVSIPKILENVFNKLNQNLVYKIDRITIKDLFEKEEDENKDIYNLLVKADGKITSLNYNIEMNIPKNIIRIHAEEDEYFTEYYFKDNVLKPKRDIYYNDKTNIILERRYTSKGNDYIVTLDDDMEFKHYVFIYKCRGFLSKINIYLEKSEDLNIFDFKEYILNEEIHDMKSPIIELQLKVFLWLNFRKYQIFKVRMNDEILKFENEKKREKIITKRREYEN